MFLPQFPETAWQRYNRGWGLIANAFLVFFTCYALTWPFSAVFQFCNGWPTIQLVVVILAIVTLIVAAPFVVSSREDPRRATLDESLTLRDGIDAIGARLGIDWDRESTATLTRLLQERQFDDVRRILKNEADRSWDDVDRLIEHWPTYLSKRKIDTVLRRLQRSTDETVGWVEPAGEAHQKV